ncbi:MAG: transglutaminase-like domain-containing protein [Thermomicrobiales bacterium]
MSTRSVSLQRDRPQGSRAGSGVLPDGWPLLVLGAFSVGLLGAVVGEYSINTDPGALATLATAGYLIGYALARTSIPDLAAHGFSFLLGILASSIAIDPAANWQQVRNGEWRLVLDRYESLLRGFISSLESNSKFETDVAVFAIGLTIWLVGYTAAWMLFRRGWIFWSIALPGSILLVTLALERERPAWPALLYLGLALAIAAAHTTLSRSAYWRSRSIDQPPSFGRRSILLGSAIAALAVGVGLYYSFDLDDRLQERAVQGGDRLASWITDRFDQSSSNPSGPQPVAGNYGAFSDQFKVGDGVPSGDVPIVVMDADDEEYLAARRLNEYDGSGWKSTTSASEDAETPAPRIAFQSDQPMNLPREQLQSRSQEEATLMVLQPTDRLLFTIDQHYAASVPSLVRVGWEPIDETVSVDAIDIASTPVDLRELVVLLQSAEFSTPDETDTPQFVSEQDQADFLRIQNRLMQSYPVNSELSWGRWRRGGPFPGSAPGLFGCRSCVWLRRANWTGVFRHRAGAADCPGRSGKRGIGLPPFIVETYLGLPETVTEQTADLANQIVNQAGATTPYEQAIAIQNYLRSNFTYQLDAGGAPDGRDIVDYFLFESKVGRCDHFASSMAVMLRTLGVPTRIVTGLAPVPYNEEMRGFVYRGRNAHAWVEVYFPGYGWIPFEPTPTQQSIDLSPSERETPTPEATLTPELTATPEGPTQSPVPSPTPTPLAAPASTDTGGTSNSDERIAPWQIGLAVGGFALLAIAGLFFVRRRNAYAGLPVAHANYGRLQRLGKFIGVSSSPELTPREYAAKFGFARPRSASGAMRVADAFTREQYSTNVDASAVARDSEFGWREARDGAKDWRLWRRR